MSILDGYKIITITHHNLNVDEIGHFMISHKDDSELKAKLHDIRDSSGIQELVYLATCNRVSFICYTKKRFDTEFLSDFFYKVNPQLSPDFRKRIPKYADIFVGEQAVQHLFEVSSSMDSLVVGEREIFRQFRQAYDKAKSFDLVGDYLRLLEKHTVVAAKSVYANTKIGEKPLSIVSLAMQDMFSRDLGDDPRILMVGAGETITLVGKFLKKKAYSKISIYNRSIDNAEKLSSMLDASSFHLSELSDHKGGFDVMIVCTGSTEPVITQKIYKNLIKSDDTTKVVIDLSVPPNVSPDVVDSHELDYINIETLRLRAETNLEFRKKEVVLAREIITDKIEQFTKVYQHRQLEKTMSQVPQEIHNIKKHAIETVYKKKLDLLDEDARSLVIEMLDYMEKKCVSIPIKAAKNLVDQDSLQ